MGRSTCSKMAIACAIFLTLPLSQVNADGRMPLKVAAVCMNSKCDTNANIEAFFSYRRQASQEGVIAVYRKHILWDSSSPAGGNEHLFWEKGPEKGLVVDSRIGRVALMICIEMSHNYSQSFAAAGVDLIVTISAWPDLWITYYDNLTKTNASSANCWHIVANQTGKVGHATDCGRSRIVDPSGKVIMDTGKEEGIIIVETDIGNECDPRLGSGAAARSAGRGCSSATAESSGRK